MSLKPNPLNSRTQKFKIQVHKEFSKESFVNSFASENEDKNCTLSPKSIIKRSQTRKFTLTNALAKIHDLQIQAAMLDIKVSSQTQTLNAMSDDQHLVSSIEHKIQKVLIQNTKPSSIQRNCLVF
ncbi:hypothetical protein SteCoe_10509 [Stentor coeruleus]|uniref:Uncharacterized protein n=1 Tax=Stentor coeruleus TaxID=5963 RepID=A0A1R2CFG2_9CILI|nr:hypothetical protein SteCoe_10509 [Stentor coeruleus]